MNKLSILFSTVILFASCTTGGVQQTSPVDNTEVPISFTGTLVKASETSLDVGDEIGIYTLHTGKLLNEQDAVFGNYTNFKYKATTPTVLSPADARYKMYYPIDVTQKVDFIAYFPYKESVTVAGNKLALDIYKQSANNDLYAMYSDNAKGADKSHASVGLQFRYALSRVVVKLIPDAESGVSINDLKGMKLTVENAYTTTLLDLKDLTFSNYGNKTDLGNKMMQFVIGDDATVNLIFLPSVGSTKIKFIFTDILDNNLYYDIPDAHSFEPSTMYNYTLKMRKQVVDFAGVEILPWINGGDRGGEAVQQ